MGSEFTWNCAPSRGRDYHDLYRTYGPRSFRYAEMVFGNTLTVRRLTGQEPQTRIFAMRTSRVSQLDEITAGRLSGHRSAALQPSDPPLGAGGSRPSTCRCT